MTNLRPTVKARSLLVVAFTNVVLDDLLTASDLFQRGQLVTALQSGTREYAAGFIGEKTLLGQEFSAAGDGVSVHFSLMLFLSE